MEFISCYVLKVIKIGFCANGGLTIVKLPIDNKVGYDVIVFLVKLLINICPAGCPFIYDGIVDRLLKTNVYARETKGE